MKTVSKRKIMLSMTDHALSPRAIHDLRKQLDLTQEQFARVLGVVTATVFRWEKGTVSPDKEAQGRLLRLKQVANELDRYFEAGSSYEFLSNPHPRLGGDRPMDMLLLSSGVNRIKELIKSMLEGDFS